MFLPHLIHPSRYNKNEWASILSIAFDSASLSKGQERKIDLSAEVFCRVVLGHHRNLKPPQELL